MCLSVISKPQPGGRLDQQELSSHEKKLLERYKEPVWMRRPSEKYLPLPEANPHAYPLSLVSLKYTGHLMHEIRRH